MLLLVKFTPSLLLTVSNAFQFASIIHWISLIILSLFFSEVRHVFAVHKTAIVKNLHSPRSVILPVLGLVYKLYDVVCSQEFS